MTIALSMWLFDREVFKGRCLTNSGSNPAVGQFLDWVATMVSKSVTRHREKQNMNKIEVEEKHFYQGNHLFLEISHHAVILCPMYY